MKIAILGYGTVGSGTGVILEQNAQVVQRSAGEDITLKYVLDIRDFGEDPIQEKVVQDISVILEDPEIETVVETMGGEEPAYTFVKAALLAGKNAVTSNKVLVAAHGAELIRIAREKQVNFFFEASVGGGIPVLRPLTECLTADHILEISGILNGTTNYMLTRMKQEGISYESVLKAAQDNGYAEKDPSADVEGFDACRKIAILASLACGRQVDYTEIPTEGITGLSQKDFAYADKLGGDIKLLGSCFFTEDGMYARVAPEMVFPEDPLCSVSGVYNAIKVRGDMLENVMFYGQGAGSLPTASAVVSDIVQTVRCRGRHVSVKWEEEKAVLADGKQFPARFLVRLSGDPESKECGPLLSIGGRIVLADDQNGEYGILTEEITQAALEEKLAGIENVLSCLRVRMTGE